jgi:rhodanese-related sulfurtransferase
MSLLSFIGFGNSKIKTALRKGAIIIDVRPAGSFDQGKIPGSVNIPVDRIAINAERIKGMNRPVIFCAAYTIHSSTAARIMKEKGLKEVYDAGNWEKVLKIVNKL